MSTATGPVCAGCHGIIEGTMFAESGQCFHSGCRPSRLRIMVQELNSEANDLTVELLDAQNRIAALEAEVERLRTDSRNYWKLEAEKSRSEAERLRWLLDHAEGFMYNGAFTDREGIESCLDI